MHQHGTITNNRF